MKVERLEEILEDAIDRLKEEKFIDVNFLVENNIASDEVGTVWKVMAQALKDYIDIKLIFRTEV